MSHPHGCVSWNTIVFASSKLGTRHTLTGVWVEIFKHIEGRPTLGSHTHGCVSWNLFGDSSTYGKPVTPSRVCELKLQSVGMVCHVDGHTLTGVWVEMEAARVSHMQQSCHTLTGVWVEIMQGFNSHENIASHPHGCVSWNKSFCRQSEEFAQSHPHGCVSWNTQQLRFTHNTNPSHPHGCVSWNPNGLKNLWYERSHTLTGVWVEIS